MVSPWAFGVPLVVLAENALNAVPNYISPNTGYQNFPEYVFVPVGTVLVCLALVTSASKRRRATGCALLTCATLVVAGWGVVWLPTTRGQWLRVPAASAHVLSQVSSEIPADAEVVASQGIFGDLSWHRWVYDLTNDPVTIPFEAHEVWFVVTPNLGIESQVPSAAMAFVRTVAALPGATMVAHDDGVWVVRWRRQGPPRSITVNQDVTSAPAYAAVGGSGVAVTTGPVSHWYVRATKIPGYVISQDYFNETTTGTYQAKVTLNAAGPVSIEVWDASTDSLLARATQVITQGRRTASLFFDVASLSASRPYQGRLIWISPPPPPPYGAAVEIRVWTPGDSTASVYDLGVTPGSGVVGSIVMH